jgi:hypothetical protein
MRIFVSVLLLLLKISAINAQALLNEVKVNPPSTDEPFEFIEIKGTPGATLNNLYITAFEGDSGSAGNCDRVFPIRNVTLGSTGLLFVGTTLGYPSVPAGTIYKDTLVFGVPGGVFENGSISFLLIFSTIPIVQGSDYDTNNDGTLELPSGAVVLDAMGWTNGDASSRVYGGVTLTQSIGTPDAAVRFYGNNTANSVSAWYNGDLVGTGNTSEFDPLEISSNFPNGGKLSPGDHNFPNPNSLPSNELIDLNIAVSPNPAQDFLTLTGHDLSADLVIQLYDLSGRKLLPEGQPYNFERIRISSLSAGIYYLGLESGDRKSYIRFVKQ